MRKVLFSVFALMLFACVANQDQKNKEEQVVVDQKRNTDDGLPQADERGYLVKVGDVAPDFDMTLTDGSVVKLSDLRGKTVMLQFTASWCGVCRKEMPHIEKDIWNKHKDNPSFALLGIDREEPLDVVIKFAEQTGITYPIGLDPKADIFASYADRRAGITRNVIIDENGKIVMLTRLFNEQEFGAMVNLIDKMLSEKFSDS